MRDLIGSEIQASRRQAEGNPVFSDIYSEMAHKLARAYVKPPEAEAVAEALVASHPIALHGKDLATKITDIAEGVSLSINFLPPPGRVTCKNAFYVISSDFGTVISDYANVAKTATTMRFYLAPKKPGPRKK
jgi:hypothetical protein